MAKILKTPQKSLFGDSGLSRGGGFTSTPRGGALVPGFGACSKRGVFWSPGEPGRDSPEGSPGPCGPRGPRDGDRAPARGVDVKPRTRDRLSPGTGVPRPPQAPEGPPDQVRDQDPGSREPGSSSPPGTRRLREVPEGPLARPGPPGGGCFTSTPRGGALSPAGVRSPGTARRDKSLQAAAGLERAG